MQIKKEKRITEHKHMTKGATVNQRSLQYNSWDANFPLLYFVHLHFVFWYLRIFADKNIASQKPGTKMPVAVVVWFFKIQIIPETRSQALQYPNFAF